MISSTEINKKYYKIKRAARMGSSLCKKALQYAPFRMGKKFEENRITGKDIKMIDTIIFDIGKVLVDWNWKEYLESFGYSQEKNEKISNAVFLSEYWKETDRGVWSDEEILQSFIGKVPEYEKEVRELWEHMEKCVTRYDYTDKWIGELKEKGYKVYYLSNYGKTLREKTAKALGFVEQCDGGIFSYEVQKIKPDIEIYQALIEKYQLNPGSCLFFDDVEENIEGARKAGIHGILFEGYEKACQTILNKRGKKTEIC